MFTACVVSQASSKLRAELARVSLPTRCLFQSVWLTLRISLQETLWRRLFEQRWGVEPERCRHGPECSCRFHQKHGWTPVAKQESGEHWRTAFKSLHQRYTEFNREVPARLPVPFPKPEA